MMELEFILRIFIAAVLGGAIGLEREYRDKAAGFRTHFPSFLGFIQPIQLGKLGHKFIRSPFLAQVIV